MFDKVISMKRSFYKTSGLNGSSYVKIPLGSFALINNKNNDKHCFLRSILAYLHPFENIHLNRVSNYEQCSDELVSEGVGFAKSLECSDVHNFEKLINLSINIFELNFYQEKNNCQQNLIPIEISENDSDRVVVFLFHKNHCFPLKENM